MRKPLAGAKLSFLLSLDPSCSGSTPALQRGTDNSTCSCSSHHWPLKVVCVSIEALCDVDIAVCTCRPAPQQLVQMGYFPCSPVYPMLAYQVLMQLVDGEMGKIIDDAREKTTAMFRALNDEMPVHGREYANVQMLAVTHQPLHLEKDQHQSPRCLPLCFGGDLDIVIPGVHLIVCLDANFQLKRNRDKDRRKEFVGLPGSLDPKVVSPRTIFLSEVQIREWEERVEVLRPSKPKMGHKRKAGKMEETEGDLMGGGRPDEIEPGMNLPNATYDACRDSFVAADGDRIKASSTYFDSTGVMALLCRHDHPLVLANLKTAGEKQFYALALISALMESIPNHWRVGVLYNIGCLCVAGHHHRLFILDRQAEHILEMKHEGMGSLMAVGKHPHGLDVEGLLVQFNEQQEFQTKSVDWQSKTKGTRVIEQILSLEMTCWGQALHEEWKERVKMAQDTISQLEDNIARKTKALRLEDRASADHLANLKKDKWINLQLNICVLHDQLITKLCAHKFELANLEHAHASWAMDQKTKSHVKKAVKQHAPGIKATVHKYNAKRKEMLKERGKNGVWRDAYVPLELVMEGLFNLDVNQDIWENADMVDFEGGEIPLWLANKEVWDGIRVAQEVKSCQEELRRCDVEYSNLHAWFVEEYEAVHNVFKFSNGTWERSLATITIPVGAVDWSWISMPPPVNHPWTCRKALQGIPQLGERDEDGDTSSDDDDGVELELVAELEDVRFLGDLDRLIGEGDWSEGEGQDNVMVDL
ncbi:hypothetical protein BS47DRAFT_1361837 [Hydnum rufescens UP504]|uniref:Uncharacterized protein n=1 Tax=Hydnum rufescens UP504 TaxID=1448309 RepID=A0A9P6DXX5_9AGAM|nr:hypothetical protein BS47DRAFT_1361837 [Hydnum rufescens UP504]